ncbi:MAG TPA: YggS family pyridoxal phosphate-dependent enzyme [Candidatus Kapabacteria bacterium]|nr:YggS family pyridoxal phosphate-dependent enzyme [Candidatus Kapabacteria bacterium]
MTLATQLEQLTERIEKACARSSRQSQDVTLIAVTKTHPPEVVKAAYDLGLREFGENRVQELLKKKEALDPDFSILNSEFSIPHWHLIGQLQSNKAKYIAPFIHLVHSIDSISTAQELSRRAEQHSRTINILVEVNVAAEASKSGIAPASLPSFLDDLAEKAPALSVKGLMTVAPYNDDRQTTRPHFIALRTLAENHRLKELSMGMSNDFEVAIEEGATMVRVGSALFGERG